MIPRFLILSLFLFKRLRLQLCRINNAPNADAVLHTNIYPPYTTARQWCWSWKGGGTNTCIWVARLAGFYCIFTFFAMPVFPPKTAVLGNLSGVWETHRLSTDIYTHTHIVYHTFFLDFHRLHFGLSTLYAYVIWAFFVVISTHDMTLLTVKLSIPHVLWVLVFMSRVHKSLMGFRFEWITYESLINRGCVRDSAIPG